LMEIGMNLKNCDGKRMSIKNETLCKQIKPHIVIVKELCVCAKELGFSIELNEVDEIPEIVVSFTRTYPSHVYSDMSMFVSRHLRFDV
jgi:hypothetical protein